VINPFSEFERLIFSHQAQSFQLQMQTCHHHIDMKGIMPENLFVWCLIAITEQW